jgi:hypothetical protein
MLLLSIFGQNQWKYLLLLCYQESVVARVSPSTIKTIGFLLITGNQVTTRISSRNDESFTKMILE